MLIISLAVVALEFECFAFMHIIFSISAYSVDTFNVVIENANNGNLHFY